MERNHKQKQQKILVSLAKGKFSKRKVTPLDFNRQKWQKRDLTQNALINLQCVQNRRTEKQIAISA